MSAAASVAWIIPDTALARRPAAARPDLFIGTGGHGHTYPGNARWDACSDDHSLALARSTGVRGNRLKIAPFFDEAGGDPIQVETGTSRSRCRRRAGRVGTRRAGAPCWQGQLDHIRVEGGTPDQRTIMASTFCHAALSPT